MGLKRTSDSAPWSASQFLQTNGTRLVTLHLPCTAQSMPTVQFKSVEKSPYEWRSVGPSVFVSEITCAIYTSVANQRMYTDKVGVRQNTANCFLVYCVYGDYMFRPLCWAIIRSQDVWYRTLRRYFKKFPHFFVCRVLVLDCWELAALYTISWLSDFDYGWSPSSVCE